MPVSLYSQPAYQSPVRADPDDLLLLPGYGFAAGNQVVYQSVTDTTKALAHPASVPSQTTAALGVADVVSVADAPYTLAVHLPSVMTKNQTYALWVVNSGGWSNDVLINDARPLWITPDFGYQTAALANLPRVLKVVGRNLQPASPSVATQVRLVGLGGTYTLSAMTDSAVTTGATDPTATPQIARYVAKVGLPTGMATGSYAVKVSRDGGQSWVALMGENNSPAQTFSVLPDPKPPQLFLVSDNKYGGCKPAFGSTPAIGNALVCVINAINAAANSGGGTVIFDAGVWTLDLADVFSNLAQGCVYTPAGASYPGVTCDGIIVPPNVNLQGGVSANSATPATITRGPHWASSGSLPTFNLQGHNTVSNLYFADQEVYTPYDDPDYNSRKTPGSVLQLGFYFWHIPGGVGPGSGGYYNPPIIPSPSISHVVITDNIFDKPYVAISNGGLPIDHLIVSDNLFGGAFNTGIYLAENQNNLWIPYTYTDSIIAFNTFYPSSFYTYTNAQYLGNSVPADSTGPLATQINTGLRADFSNNMADGRSTAYFYNQPISPTNPSGWRAGYFWSTGRGQELTLVSQNQALCAGDKAGDGEAIAYDHSAISGGLLDVSGQSAAALNIIGAAPWTDPNTGNPGTAVTVQGQFVDPVVSGQTMASQAATAFYPGQWLQIVQGVGIGQWRKIASVATTGSNALGKTITFNVAPPFDVPPQTTQPNSGVVTVGPAYWQNATVDNNVDESLAVGCTQLNQNYKNQGGNIRPNPNAGVIAWDGPTADSAIEGNQQTNGAGIGLYAYFAPAAAGNSNSSFAIVQSSGEVRNNVVNGQYKWTSPYSFGGIYVNTGAAVNPLFASTLNPTNPPVMVFGTTIAGNNITQAHQTNFSFFPSVTNPMGAISVSPGLNDNGPQDSNNAVAWKVTNSTLIFHNSLNNITGGGLSRVGVGISAIWPLQAGEPAPQPEVWHSVLYANSCANVQTDMVDYGTGTVRYCPSGASTNCECKGSTSIDVGISVSVSAPSIAIGGILIYTMTITNYDTANSATGVNIALEPSAGIEISKIAGIASTAVCDSSVNTCSIGVLAHGQSAQVTVIGTAVAAGTWSNTVSVTHQEPDPMPGNDGVTVDTTVY